MLQELEVRKSVVHAVFDQSIGKVMAVLSILSEVDWQKREMNS